MAIEMTPPQWLEWTGAQAIGRVSALEGLASVVTDSREALAGTLFVTLEGEKTQGWAYTLQALENGCRAMLGPSEAGVSFRAGLEDYPDAVFLIVENTLESLHTCAKKYREKFPQTVCIGVTGSQGKTGVKEMLKSVFEVSHKVIATNGNHNSVISLPGEIFRLVKGAEFAILEMGIDHPGEMEMLAKAVAPDAAIITAIGSAHSGPLGGRDGIAIEKKKILSQMSPNGVAILPEDDDYFEFLKEGFAGEVLPFSLKIHDLGAVSVKDWNETQFTWKGNPIRLKMGGRHHVRNAAAVILAAKHYQVAFDDIRKGLESLKPLPGRGLYHPGAVNIYDDTYNANPQSMGALLNLAEEVPSNGRLLLVLGSMKELDENTVREHRRLGEDASALKTSGLFFVGDEARDSYEAAMGMGYKGWIGWEPTAERASNPISEWLGTGDTAVLKGSRSVGLEKVISTLARRFDLVI